MGGEGSNGSNSISSIRKSILRIAEQGYDDISGDSIIVARVTETFSDVVDTETFGTMTCFDSKSKIEIGDIPLNAHIGDDGSTSISGKYTFPKVGSDVYLLRDVDDNHERYICILFSHVESVFETYNTSKTTRVVEVDTPDPDEPYDTNETGNYLEEISMPTIYSREVVDEDGGLNSKITQDSQKVEVIVDNGSDSTTVISEAGTHTVDTGTTTPESAVLGETLKGLIEDLIDAIDGIGTTVPSLGLISGAAGTPVTGVAAGSLDAPSKAALAVVKGELSTMLLTNFKVG